MPAMPEPSAISDSSPRVSVVMAAYDYGHYIAQAIQSVVDQTFVDWELIIVDDGSTDDTRDVVTPFLTDERIHYHYQVNRGQPGAENTGINLSRGQFLAFLDADDVWLPTKLAKQLGIFESSPQTGVVYSGRITIDPNGRELAPKPQAHFRGRVLHQLFRDNFVCFSSSVVRREVFKDVGLFNEEYRHANDYDLWLRAAMHWGFDVVDEPLVRYRTGHANLTSRGDTQLLTALKIMQRFAAAHKDVIPPSLLRQCFVETYCHLALAYRDRSVMRALLAYMDAFRWSPFSYGVWRGVASLCMPESMRRILRRMLGQPVDWRHRQLLDVE